MGTRRRGVTGHHSRGRLRKRIPAREDEYGKARKETEHVSSTKLDSTMVRQYRGRLEPRSTPSRSSVSKGKSMKKFHSVPALAAIFFFLYVSSSRAAEINVVWTSEVGQFAPLWITKEAKLFEKYGNTVQLIFIQGASSAAAALSSGDAQVGMFSPQVVISTPALDLVMFGRLGNSMDNRIFARKGIKSIKEVKRVAISRFGSSADFAAGFLLQREGLKPDIDVALLQVGNQSNRIVAVETNNAD